MESAASVRASNDSTPARGRLSSLGAGYPGLRDGWLATGVEVSLLDVVRSAVKIADDVTKPLQALVVFERCTGTNGYGDLTYAAAVSLRAVVDWKQKQLRTMTGVLSVSRASVMFLDIAALSAATAGLGVDDLDRITLPDGTTGPILDMSGFIDAGTGQPIATEVYLG